MYGAAFLLLILFAELSVEHGALSSVSVYGDCLLPFEQEGITGSVLLIIFRSLISLCFITCLIRISFNLKNDQKNRPHDPLSYPLLTAFNRKRLRMARVASAGVSGLFNICLPGVFNLVVGVTRALQLPIHAVLV